MLTLRDPIHGFIRADRLETALINSRPLQRLRFIHQLGFTYLVYPGAEHHRFSHVLGVMHLAGRVHDQLTARPGSPLEAGDNSYSRRLVRAAALLHDIGHAPFSHSAESLFEGGIDHETMTRRLLESDEIGVIFERWGDGLTPAAVARILADPADPTERLLSQIISGELDVDKMDYLLRDSLYCGVRYGSYDLDRLLDTIEAIRQPDGDWSLGIDQGGIHTLEALVMARYYMFTQVYFNVTGKALELHFSEWLLEVGRRWPSTPGEFLDQDDISILSAMRADTSRHARAVVERRHFPLAFETDEHLDSDEKERFAALLPELRGQFGAENILVSNSAKDPHRRHRSGVLVRRFDGSLMSMERASQFIRHLTRIERYRIYTRQPLRGEVAQFLTDRWTPSR